METITDPAGLVWQRSADRTKLVCLSDGREVLGIPEMSTDYLLSVAMMPAPKTDADRITELEAQVQTLLTKLNTQ
jgi:hypothetical protein